MTTTLENGLFLRVGSARESAAQKAIRLLAQGRVQVRRVDGRGVLAEVRGDSGALRTVTYESGLWSCDCPARRDCSHVRAVQQVVVTT